MKTHSEKFIKQRRFYVALPMLVLPFLTMIFWALGGGAAVPPEASASPIGLDTTLPDAHFSKDQDGWNKLNYYQEAEKDSLRSQKARASDPYYALTALTESTVIKASSTSDQPVTTSTTLSTGLNLSVEDKVQKDPLEEKVSAKLQQLYAQMKAPAQDQPITTTRAEVAPEHDEAFSQDVARLEKMMEMMGPESTADPEMDQLSGVLDKILDIQHPERAKEKIRQESLTHEKQVYPVASYEPTVVSFFSSNSTGTSLATDTVASQVITYEPTPSNGFFDVADDDPEAQQDNTLIQAIIHDTQELTAGAEVRIRLLQDVYVNGKLIQKDEVIYGTCGISGDRFTISISAISLMPVALKVYDLNGIEGIHIPGTITQDAARQGANQAIQSMQLYNGMDASLETQVASAGVQAAKGLFAKKAKVAKGIVKAGYRIVLRDAGNKG